jgi:hypothetical protein
VVPTTGLSHPKSHSPRQGQGLKRRNARRTPRLVKISSPADASPAISGLKLTYRSVVKCQPDKRYGVVSRLQHSRCNPFPRPENRSCFNSKRLCFEVKRLCFELKRLCFELKRLCFEAKRLRFEVKRLCFEVKPRCSELKRLCFEAKRQRFAPER